MSTPVQTTLGAFVWHDHASRNPQKAQQFYTTLFGWQTEVPGELDYTLIVADGKQHGGFWPPAEGDAPPQWLGHVLVDDVDATAGRAEAAGGSLLFEPMDAPEGRRFAVIRDPEGAAVSAYSSPGEPSPPQGVFGWDELYVDDIERAKSFYSEVFRWTTSELDMGAGRSYTMFSLGDQQRAGALTKPPGMQAPAHWLVYILSDDVDGHAAKAKELGAQVFMEPFDIPTVGRLAILADPTGAPFGLFKAKQ
jgi:predicted enzyme related to lactoylglutathione lyase